MEFRDIQPYTGMHYDRDTFDCADFAIHVARDLFGYDVTLPSSRPRGKGCEAHLADASKAYGIPTTTPEDGDIVLMFDFEDTIAPTHVGIYIRIGYASYVLHSAAKLGGSVMTEMHQLSRLGLTVEGFYKWIPASSSSSDTR